MVLALFVVCASTLFLMRQPPTPPQVAAGEVPTVTPQSSPDQATGLHVYLVPHPDDELSAWTSLIEGGDLHPVMVVLTQGEATDRCEVTEYSIHLATGLGEIPPRPDPSTEEATAATCREARMSSFQEVLTTATVHTPAVALDWAHSRFVEVGGHPVTVVPGMAATLLLLDLGDDTLTADRVEEMTRLLLESTDVGLPDLPVTRVTASAYYATQHAADRSSCSDTAVCLPGEPSYVFDRPDHLAARDAARSLAPLTEEGSWLVTHPDDLAASRHLALPVPIYQQFMGLGPGDPPTAQRLGSYQQAYGWLAFPDAWRPGDLPLERFQVLFPRVQSYEVVTP